MKFKRMMMAFVAGATLLFAGCEKDLDLNGTTWVSNYTLDLTQVFLDDDEDNAQIIEMLGGKFLMDFSMEMNFKNDVDGVMQMDMTPSSSMNIPSMLKPYMEEMEYSDDEDFTYTFDGKKGTLNMEGELASLEYNSSDKTLTVVFDDEEFAEVFGVKTLVCKQKK